MQEKRLRQKQEQEDRRAKRQEEKNMRRKLLQQQDEARDAKRAEIAEATRIAEDNRQTNIRSKGLDLLDLSSQSLREVPPILYTSPEAKTKLTFLVRPLPCLIRFAVGRLCLDILVSPISHFFSSIVYIR